MTTSIPGGAPSVSPALPVAPKPVPLVAAAPAVAPVPAPLPEPGAPERDAVFIPSGAPVVLTYNDVATADRAPVGDLAPVRAPDSLDRALSAADEAESAPDADEYGLPLSGSGDIVLTDLTYAAAAPSASDGGADYAPQEADLALAASAYDAAYALDTANGADLAYNPALSAMATAAAATPANDFGPPPSLEDETTQPVGGAARGNEALRASMALAVQSALGEGDGTGSFYAQVGSAPLAEPRLTAAAPPPPANDRIVLNAQAQMAASADAAAVASSAQATPATILARAAYAMVSSVAGAPGDSPTLLREG